MLILGWWQGGEGEASVIAEPAEVGAVDVLTAARVVEHAADDLYYLITNGRPSPEGRGTMGVYEPAPGVSLQLGVEDVLVTVSWQNKLSHPQLDCAVCRYPSWGQLGALAAYLEEIGRHQYRMRIAQLQTKQVAAYEQQKAAIERVANRIVTPGQA